MAQDDIEIEIKIAASKEDFLKIKEKVEKIAVFANKTSHNDCYFTPSHRDFLAPKFPFEWLSIRKRGEKSSINYKHFHPENSERYTHCDEFETDISKASQLEKIFSCLNFRKLICVEKEREVYIYQETFEIDLDYVKDLGYFIEIEALKHMGSIADTRKKLFEFASILGIDHSKADKRGYPHLLMLKKGLMK
jgi:predicted adenylyl cyclase CyaB